MRHLCAAFRSSSQQIKERILEQLTEELREVDPLHRENEQMLYAYLAEQTLKTYKDALITHQTHHLFLSTRGVLGFWGFGVVRKGPRGICCDKKQVT